MQQGTSYLFIFITEISISVAFQAYLFFIDLKLCSKKQEWR